MENLKKFIAENPQITASFVTAIFGVLGIFINIFINIHFRKQDYKCKDKIKKIENIESYYIPLLDMIEYLYMLLNGIKQENEKNLYNILEGKLGASYSKEVKLIKDLLKELNDFFNKKNYKFYDNYKLYMSHKRVRNLVYELNRYSIQKSTGEVTTTELAIELNRLMYRIHWCVISTIVNNPFYKVAEYIRLFKRMRKNKLL